MPSPAVRAAFVALMQSAFAAEIAAGTVIVDAFENDLDPDPPPTRAGRSKTLVLIEFEPSDEAGEGLGAAGYVSRVERGIVFFHALADARTGLDALDAASVTIKRALRRPDIPSTEGVLSLVDNVAEGDRGLRHGDALAGVSLFIDYVFEFQAS